MQSFPTDHIWRQIGYLYTEKAHRDESNPAVKRVEMGQWDHIMPFEDRQESTDETEYGQKMEGGVQKLHIEPPRATSYPVH